MLSCCVTLPEDYLLALRIQPLQGGVGCFSVACEETLSWSLIVANAEIGLFFALKV